MSDALRTATAPSMAAAFRVFEQPLEEVKDACKKQKNK